MTYLLLLLPLLSSVGLGKDVVTVQEYRNVCTVRGISLVTSSSSTIWNVLTDYNHAPEFIESVKESHIVDTLQNTRIVRQTLEGHFLWFHKSFDVVLYVTEFPEELYLSFKDMRHKDFDTFEGVWSVVLVPDSDNEYRIKLEGTFDKADLFGCSPIKKQVQRTLTQVLNEIQRRSVAVTSYEPP